MAISMLKIRRPLGRLIFNMGIAIPGKTVFLIETAPRSFICATKGLLFTYNNIAVVWHDTALVSHCHYEQFSNVEELHNQYVFPFKEPLKLSMVYIFMDLFGT